MASYTSHACFIFLWGVSLTHLMLRLFCCGEFRLHISCRLNFYLENLSDISHAGFIFMWGVSLTHLVLASFLSGEFLLHIPCWLHFYLGSFRLLQIPCCLLFYLGSFSYTSRAGFIFIWRVSLTHPMLIFFVDFFFLNLAGGGGGGGGERFLLHIPCWLYFHQGSFSYNSHVGFFYKRFFFIYFIWGVSLTHPVLASFLRREFLLHIPCWFQFYARGFSYKSCAVTLIYYYFLNGLFLLNIPSYTSHFYLGSLWHIPCWIHFYVGSFSYTSHAGFNFVWGISLTHSMLALFVCGEFLLHIPCWLLYLFNLGSFSYTSQACFIFIWGVSLTHPVLASFFFFFILGVSLTHPVLRSFLSGKVLLHIPCRLHFYLASFSYTSHVCFILPWGVSLTHPMLAFLCVSIWGVFLTHPVIASFLYGEFLLHTPLLFFVVVFYLGSFSYTYRAGFIFYLGSFSYTSRRATFIFMQGVSLTHPVLASFLCMEFFFHIHCWLHFYLRRFSYTSCADFIFTCGVSLTHPMLPFFLFFFF